MEIVKRNILSILCGVVALAALVAYFWPVRGYHSRLEADVQQRASVYNEMDRMMTQSRLKPVVSLENTEQERLDRFPSRTVIEAGRQATQHVEQESVRLYQTAVQINQRDLLVPNSFPRPGVHVYTFRERYRQMLDQGIPQQILRGGPPPGEREFAQATEQLRAQLDREIIRINNQPVNQQDIQRRLQEETAQLRQDLPKQASTNYMVYVDRNALSIHPHVYGAVDAAAGRRGSMGMNMGMNMGAGQRGTGAPSPEELWYAQIGLWIQQDVARAIAAANQGSQNVMQSPVKRLLRIELPQGNPYVLSAGEAGPGMGMGMGMYDMYGPDMDFGMDMYGMPGAPRTAEPAAPVELPSDPTAELKAEYHVSPTGRVSNGLYDVVHFDVIMDVDAEMVPMVMSELSRERFITVRRIDNLMAVDSALEQVQGYFYGNRPVVRLTLACEALFLREWTKPLMPTGVKRILAGVQETQR